MATSIAQPLPVFLDDNGAPLDGGYVYIGTQGFEPITNPQAVFWDEALAIPAASPLRTKMGFLYRDGAPARAYVANGYSITVKDANLVTVLTDWSVNSGGGVVLGTMATQNAGTAGSEFRTNAENDARFVLASSYVPTAVQYPNQFKIMNGDFSVNQRAFTTVSTPPTINQFTVDRWRCIAVNDTTAGLSCTLQAPVSSTIGHLTPKNIIALTSTGQVTTGSRMSITHRIESARTYSGQNMTLFGWSKRATAGNVAVSVIQSFGTGGSPSATVHTYIGQIALTTSWSGWKLLCPIPSIAGKTLGTNGDDYLDITIWTSAGSTYNAATGSLGLFNTTVDFYGIHERVGDVPIEAINYYQPPDPQAELARCQRYFGVFRHAMRVGSTANGFGAMPFPVPMRAAPTTSLFTYSGGATGATYSVTATGIAQVGASSAAARVDEFYADAEL